MRTHDEYSRFAAARELGAAVLTAAVAVAIWLAAVLVFSAIYWRTPAYGAEHGIASVYADSKDGYAWSKTANGERVNPYALTAAHKTLPFGTRVTVTNQHNGRSVVVRINDRGPYRPGRIIDLTPAGALALGFDGLASVTVQ